jgi:hypothetical protein
VVRNDKCKIHPFAVNMITILRTGRTVASVKYDSKKQLNFEIYNNINERVLALFMCLYNSPRESYKISISILAQRMK